MKESVLEMLHIIFLQPIKRAIDRKIFIVKVLGQKIRWKMKLRPQKPNCSHKKSPLILCVMICVFLTWATGAMAQDMMPLSSMALAIAGTFQKACNTNEFSAQIQVEACFPTFNITNILKIQQSGQIFKTEFKLSEFVVTTNQARFALSRLDLDNVVVVIHVDTEQVVFVFPGMKGYFDAEKSPQLSDLIKSFKGAKLDRTPLGEEHIQGHACQKIKLSEHGKTSRSTAISWEPDNSGIPVQIEVFRPNNSLKFRTLEFDSSIPPAMEFEVPPGYTKYASFAEVAEQARKQSQDGTRP